MDLSRYAELFSAEAREHLAEIDSALQILAEDEHSISRISESIDSIFRSVHTIKGMAGTMGYGSVERTAHAFESLLEALRNERISLDRSVLSLCYDASDSLAQHVDDAIQNGIERQIDGVLFDRLASASESLSESRTVDKDVENNVGYTESLVPEYLLGAMPDLEEKEHNRATNKIVEIKFVSEAPFLKVRARMIVDRLEKVGKIISVYPDLDAFQDEHDDHLEIVLLSDRDDESISDIVVKAGDVLSVRTGQYLNPVSRIDYSPHIRVDFRKLDTLLDLAGELAIARDRLANIAELSGEALLVSATRDTSRLIDALQAEIQDVRMVAMGYVFDRFPRLVRELSKELGKDIVFTMEGRDIELDRSMTDSISDPLVHLLRNAIDHGIESKDHRLASGKTAAGHISVSAKRDRDFIVISVEDDGAGIDIAKVTEKAIASGRVVAGTASLNEDSLVGILSQPGFSTAKSITSVSGRGVGIDVVATKVRSLGGTLRIKTVLGAGTSFSLRLPSRLSLTRALIIDVDGHNYAVPSSSVVEVAEFEDGETDVVRNRDSMLLRGERLNLVSLRSLFGAEGALSGVVSVVVLDVSGSRFGLIVDSVRGQQQIVIKPFYKVSGSAPYFSGATILGDGKPSLIVDVESLA